MIPPDFEAQALYEPSAWYIHDVLSIDRALRQVVALVDTTRLGPLVDAQRVLPGHKKHFPGAIAIQVTGTLGQLCAVYVLDMPSSEGWVGFGTHIVKARFPRMGEIGPPVLATCTVSKLRQVRKTVFVTYDFLYQQEGQAIYESTQNAAYFQGL